MARKQVVVSFSPGEGPFDTPSWVTLTAGGPHGNRVASAEWAWGRERDDEAYPPGTCTIVLRNHDRLFDPDNTSGTYSGQLLPRVPFRLQTDGGEDLFYGFVEDGWEQTYQHPEDGYCTIQLVDLLAVIEGYTLPSVFTVEVLADNPVAYWPLDEEAGLAMRDASGNHGDGEYVVGTTELSGTAESVDGAQVVGLDLDGEHYGQLRDIAATAHERPACVEVVFRPNTEVATQILYRSGTGNANEGNTIQYSGFGDTWQLISAIRDGDSNNLVNTAAYSVYGDQGTLHHYVHQRPSVGDSVGWLDGVDATDSVATSPANGISVAPGSVVGAADYQAGGAAGAPPSNAYRGFVGAVAIYDTDIGSSRIAAHAEAVLAPLAGLRSDEHIAWALDQIGVPAGMRDLDEGRSILGPADTHQQNALSFIRTVTRTEQGHFYVNHADGGKLRFAERYTPWVATRSTVSQATFSDDPSVTTAARVVDGSLVVESNGIRTVVNQVKVKWTGGEQTAENSTSVAAYGPRGRSIDTVAPNPNQALSLAQWLVELAGEPKPRVRGLGINPAGAEDEFDIAVDTRVLDLVTFRSQPAATGSVVTRSLLVEGVHHQVEGLDWDTTFFVSDTPANQFDLFTLGTSLLDGPDVLAY